MELSYILENTDLKNALVDYCRWLANEYNRTLSGSHRIKYNELYPILFSNISENKKIELWDSFLNSNDFNPIKKFTPTKLVLRKF